MTTAGLIVLVFAIGFYCGVVILGTIKATRHAQRAQEQRVDEKYTEWQWPERHVGSPRRTGAGSRP